MDFNRFTEKLQDGVRAAQSKAIRLGHQQVDTEHLFAALLEQEGGLAPSILFKAKADVKSIHRRLEEELGRRPKVASPTGAADQIYVTTRLQRTFTEAEDEARTLKDDYVSIEHVLLALTDDSGLSGSILKELGITKDTLRKALQEVRGSQRVTTANPDFRPEPSARETTMARPGPGRAVHSNMPIAKATAYSRVISRLLLCR